MGIDTVVAAAAALQQWSEAVQCVVLSTAAAVGWTLMVVCSGHTTNHIIYGEHSSCTFCWTLMHGTQIISDLFGQVMLT
jgi:hypothetical protein